MSKKEFTLTEKEQHALLAHVFPVFGLMTSRSVSDVARVGVGAVAAEGLLFLAATAGGYILRPPVFARHTVGPAKTFWEIRHLMAQRTVAGLMRLSTSRFALPTLGAVVLAGGVYATTKLSADVTHGPFGSVVVMPRIGIF